MKDVLRQLLSATLGKERFGIWLGVLDYALNRSESTGFGGPLNGSPTRLSVFRELMRRLSFATVVETGTYRGESTAFFAASGCRVYSTEINPRRLGYAKARLHFQSKVHFFLSDSRHFLRLLIQDPNVSKDRIFFYLDAHETDDVPLLEELELIFANWNCPVVMVDDFQVPDDSGYQFQDYGEGNKLILEYLNPVAHLGLTSFFPVLPSSEELGLKQGWVILARDDFSIGQLREIMQIREFGKIEKLFR